jgi:cytokinesis protein
MEEFLDELAKPAEAYRGLCLLYIRNVGQLTQLTPVNTQDIRKDLGELRDGLKRIRQELNDYYTDLALGDGFSNQMWTFIGKATSRLEYLVDDVNLDTTFTEVVRYFGEDEKNMTSTEFFAVFKTFVTSYKVSGPSTSTQTRWLSILQKCKTENQTAAEEKAAVEKRKQAMAKSRQLRQNAKDAGPKEEDDAVLDNLLEKLRSGDTVTRRARRGRPKPDTRPIIPPLATAAPFDTTVLCRNFP